MKTLLTLCVTVLTITGAFAQAPSKMSYQAVIRDANEQLITNQTIGMQFSIIRDDIDQTVVYVETQTPTTNDNGLVSVAIGGGTVVDGDFSQIEWANGRHLLKREIDPNGETSYTISGTSELLSVPYALYADKVEHYADGDYVMNYTWQGDLNGENSEIIASTSADWKGGRTIMMNGYVNLDFEFPSVAIDNGLDVGQSDVDMYLKYDGQIIMPVPFRGMAITEKSNITLPITALIANSTAGTSKQFTLEGHHNSSTTGAMAQIPPAPSYGPYPVDVQMIVVMNWVEL
jgi:hypothetical protein